MRKCHRVAYVSKKPDSRGLHLPVGIHVSFDELTLGRRGKDPLIRGPQGWMHGNSLRTLLKRVPILLGNPMLQLSST